MVFVCIVSYIYLPSFLNNAFVWIICFYIGECFRNNMEWIDNKKYLLSAIVLMLIGLSWQYSLGNHWYDTNMLSLTNFVSKICSIFVLFYVFKHIPKGKMFNYFTHYGKYSLIIYLVHAPAASIYRILLMRIGISDFFILSLLIIILAWCTSILVCYLSNKLFVVNVIFYPYRHLVRKFY